MSNIYMFIDGIDGNVTAKGHERWIQIESLQFLTQRQFNTTPGNTANREGARPAVGEFIISKVMDKTSPQLFSEAVVGTTKPEVIIDLTTVNDTLAPYMKYTLSNVMISRYSVEKGRAALNNEDQPNHSQSNHEYPMEIIQLNFDKIEMKFTPFDQNNKPQSPIPAGYDLSLAKAL